MITVPMWVVLLVISLAVIVYAATRRPESDWDFTAPVISLGLVLLVLLFWVGYGVGRIFK